METTPAMVAAISIEMAIPKNTPTMPSLKIILLSLLPRVGSIKSGIDMMTDTKITAATLFHAGVIWGAWLFLRNTNKNRGAKMIDKVWVVIYFSGFWAEEISLSFRYGLKSIISLLIFAKKPSLNSH